MPIQPLPPNLPGQDTAADRLIAGKVNELVGAANAQETTNAVDAAKIAENAAAISVNAAKIDSGATQTADLARRTSALESQTATLTKAVQNLNLRVGTLEQGTGSGDLPDGPPDPTPAEWEAELPRAFVDMTYTPATGGTISVASIDELKAAIAQIPDGGEIILTADIVGNVVVSAKRIIIRATNLPPPGKRVTPSANALTMPKWRTAAATPILTAINGASVRLVGLYIGAVPELKELYSFVEFGQGSETAVGAMPKRCIVDRCIVQGHDALDVRRGVRLEGVECGVVDSWIAGIHTSGDGCAIFASNGPGPFAARNSYLESTGENFMIGGADAKIPGVLPSDITMDSCHAKKLLAWKDNPGLQYRNLKNLGECKVASRMHIIGCVFENNVVSQQPGYALVLSATDQERTAPWSTVEDFTMQWCRYDNVMSFANLTGWVFDADRFWTRRVSIRDSLINRMAPGPRVGVLLQRHTAQAELLRCTFENCDYMVAFEGGAKIDGGLKGIRIKDNLASCGALFHSSDGTSQTAAEVWFDQYAPGRIVSGNVAVGYSDPLPPTSPAGVNRAELARQLTGVVIAP